MQDVYSVHLDDAELSASTVYHDSNSTEAIADHYNIVVSGVKLGRGSRQNAAVQEFILRDTLQMRPKRLVDFENLLDGLRAIFLLYVGLVLGFGRLIAVMLGRCRLEMSTFLKTGEGEEDAMVRALSEMTEEVLEAYHLKLRVIGMAVVTIGLYRIYPSRLMYS